MYRTLVFIITSFLFFGLFACGEKQTEEYLGPRVVIAQWNIGHFSGGNSINSTILTDDIDKKMNEYREIIRRISADIFSVNEFSAVFANDKSGKSLQAKDVLFSDFAYNYVGHQSRYSCNALFSKKELNAIKEIDYDCNQVANIEKATHIQATDYYLIESNIQIEGFPVKIVTTHLAFDYDNDEIAKNQILEIIQRYNDEERIILCGDWNIMDVNFFDYFKAAGYQLANHGNHGDFITYSRGSILDNIMVKGYEIKGARVIKTPLSDHYPLVVTIAIGK